MTNVLVPKGSLGHVTFAHVARRLQSLNVAFAKAMCFFERLGYLWSGCPLGLGYCGPPDKNNMDSSESSHPLETKIIHASEWGPNLNVKSMLKLQTRITFLYLTRLSLVKMFPTLVEVANSQPY